MPHKKVSNYILFWGKDTPLSNHYLGDLPYEEHTVPSSEHVFMIKKAELFAPEYKERLFRSTCPSGAKRIGRRIPNFNERIWNDMKYQCMMETIKHKFIHDAKFKKLVCKYAGYTFVEASPYDSVWGIGRTINQAKNDIGLAEFSYWGQNLLGQIITKIANE